MSIPNYEFCFFFFWNYEFVSEISQVYTISGCKDIGIRQFQFVTIKSQFLQSIRNLKTMMNCFGFNILNVWPDKKKSSVFFLDGLNDDFLSLLFVNVTERKDLTSKKWLTIPILPNKRKFFTVSFLCFFHLRCVFKAKVIKLF